MSGGPDSGKKVVGVGLACLDQLILWRDMHAPVAGNNILDFQVQGGGMVGTSMVAVARLGGQAEFWGAVGDDWMGRMILEEFRCENVDTRHVVVVPGGRGPMVVVCVDRPTGQRHFLYWAGFPGPEGPIGSLESLKTAGCLLVDGTHHGSTLRAAREAQRLSVPVVADLGGVGEKTAALLAHVTYAIISDRCAQQVGGGGDYLAACQAVRSMGPRHVVVTLGERGLVYLEGEELAEMPAFEVEVVDTTGAGDVFHGAFCYGLVQGFPLVRNLQFASAVAAMKCGQLGGRAGIPGRDQAVRFLIARGVDWPEGL
jgi:sulfofructose kinase